MRPLTSIYLGFLSLALSAALVAFCYTAQAATELTTLTEVKAAFAKHRPMVIMVYATWCGACKATRPEYLKAEKALAGKVDFYLMDADRMTLHTNGSTTQPISIDAIPTFLAGSTEEQIRSGTTQSAGGRPSEEIIKYVKRSTGVQ